jgi:hypothetical protein
MSETVIEAKRVSGEIEVADFEHAAWDAARAVALTRYWSGEQAPPWRHAEARLVWDAEALYVRFVYPQQEPLVAAAEPETERKTIGLWDRDVCELYVAPDANAPEKYFEFEAAPTGEWLDLAISWHPTGRETDWEFQSGMQTAARVGTDVVMMTIRVPFAALGRTPRAGERWRANLFRCVGAGETRGYIAWQPTHAPEPNFHVPQKFGWLEFK